MFLEEIDLLLLSFANISDKFKTMKNQFPIFNSDEVRKGVLMAVSLD